jgi:hypothetical protein
LIASLKKVLNSGEPSLDLFLREAINQAGTVDSAEALHTNDSAGDPAHRQRLRESVRLTKNCAKQDRRIEVSNPHVNDCSDPPGTAP